MKGKVYLVGAGPGDPELLTWKALRLLKTCDAVLHDDLVTPEILALVSPAAERRNVGKRCGAKRITQAEINFLMTTMAEAGKVVVRLKSGDPLIFGRCGEEIEALRKARISFEIVPGISAALAGAAAAQIPVTHRDGSHAFVFISGCAAEGKQHDWTNLISAGATLAIYMPGRNYQNLSHRLTKAGLNPATPCAIVSSATRPTQEIQVSTVENLVDLAPVVSPAILIVGDIVRFASRPTDSMFAAATNFGPDAFPIFEGLL